MNRLTKCSRWHDDIDLKEEMGYAYIYDRLAQYENTGLSPNDVWDLCFKFTDNAEEDEKLLEDDKVNSPAHYTNGYMEAIDEMIMFFGKEKVMAFCECNIWKYRKRALDKNGREDMQKADVYVKFYKALYDGKDVHYYLKPESCDSK